MRVSEWSKRTLRVDQRPSLKLLFVNPSKANVTRSLCHSCTVPFSRFFTVFFTTTAISVAESKLLLCIHIAKLCCDLKIGHGHLLIFLHTPPLEEALTNFVYREDQLAANRTCINSRASALEVADGRFCCAAQPGEAKGLVFRAAPAMPQCEPPHQHTNTAPSWRFCASLKCDSRFPETIGLVVLDALLQKLVSEQGLFGITFR